MKIRNGFVSNSSSSSFIIAIAKIVDKQKFNAKFAKVLNGDFSVLKVKDVALNGRDYPSKTKTTVEVSSFMGDAVSIPLDKLSEEDEVVAYYFCGNEGDGCFCYGDSDADGYDYPDYDISDDFFEKQQQAVMDLFNDSNNGLEDAQLSCGAGRNG